MTNNHIKIRCPECGHLCEESDSYCESCGFPLSIRRSSPFPNHNDVSHKPTDTSPNQSPRLNTNYGNFASSIDSFLNQIIHSIWNKRIIKIIYKVLVISAIYSTITIYIYTFEPTYHTGSFITRFFNKFIWLVDMIEKHIPWLSALCFGIFDFLFYTAVRKMLKKHAISSTITILIGVCALSTICVLFTSAETALIIALLEGALCIEIGIKMNKSTQDSLKSVGFVWIICYSIMLIIGIYIIGETSDIAYLSNIGELSYSDFKHFRYTSITIAVIGAICEIVVLKKTIKLILSDFDNDKESFSES